MKTSIAFEAIQHNPETTQHKIQTVQDTIQLYSMQEESETCDQISSQKIRCKPDDQKARITLGGLRSSYYNSAKRSKGNMFGTNEQKKKKKIGKT